MERERLLQQLSTLLTHPMDHSIRTKDLITHHCIGDCYEPSKESCFTTFYNTIPQHIVLYQDIYKETDINFPEPYLDITLRSIESMGHMGWFSEIENLSQRIIMYRNPALDYTRKLDQQTTFTIKLGQCPNQTIKNIRRQLMDLFTFIENRHDHIPFCAMELFGRSDAHPNNTTKTLPTKLIITDTLYFVLEIIFPIRDYETDSAMEYCYCPAELNRLLELFDPKTGEAILLTFDPIVDIETVISAFRQCEGGHKIKFPGYIDVLALWVYLGSWTLDTNIEFMYRLIVGGTIINIKSQDDRSLFLNPFIGLNDWKRCYIVAYCRAIISLFESFFIIHIERILPEKDRVRDAFRQPAEGFILERLISIVSEAMAYINFDRENYPETAPFHKYRCVQPTYVRGSVLTKSWGEYCEMQKSQLFHRLEQIWPWQRPIITRLGWMDNRPMDPRLIEFLFHRKTWFSIYEINDKKKENSETQLGDEAGNPNQDSIEEPDHQTESERSSEQETLHNLCTSSNHLNQILETIDINRAKAWKVLSDFLVYNPHILKDWFKRKYTRFGTQYTDDFYPDTRANFRRLCKIAKKVLPDFRLSNIRR